MTERGEREGGRGKGGERDSSIYAVTEKTEEDGYTPENHTHSDLPTVEWVGPHFIRQLQILILSQVLIG